MDAYRTSERVKMASHFPRPVKVCFGPYELDPGSGELRKGGASVKLNPQPFRVLCMLVERAGQTVTREEIRDTLWGADTYVEFERGINFCVSQIRAALCDEVQAPRYVETLPKRGYRFIAQVSGVMGHGSVTAAAGALVAGAPVTGAASIAEVSAGGPGMAAVYELRAPATSEAGEEELQDPSALDPSVRETRASRVGSVRRGKYWFAAALLVLVIAGIAAVMLWPERSERPVMVSSTAITHDGRPKGTYATLATDGTRVYFQESAASRSFIAQVAASGGETAEIHVGLTVPTIYDLSPDGSKLLLGAPAEHGIDLWIQPVPQGSLRRVGDVKASDGGWAPDGEHIVYVDGESVMESRADGSEVRLLARTGGAAAWPRLSPDGARVRFTVFDPKASTTKLWEVEIDGTGLQEVLAGWNPQPRECCGNWTSDGKYFVFESERSGASNLWMMREGRGAARGKPVQLTNGPLNFHAPRPSRDGKAVFAIGRQELSELVRVNPQTGGVEPYLGGISAMQVRISPDKQRAVWVSYPDGTLWSGKLDGSERRQLTEAPLRAEYPRWSPDGMKISFTGMGAGKALGVYVVGAEGGSARRIGPENAVTLSWAPDGKRAAVAVFGAREGVAGDAAAGEAAVAALPGEWIELMDLATGRTTVVQGSENLIGPDWSPDGKYLLAKSKDDHRVMLYDVAAAKWRELAHGGVMTNLRWSRDGSYAYFEEASAEEAELMRIRVEDRDADGKNDWASERVMDFRNIRRPLVTLSTAWSGLAEDDAPIFQRDIGTQEIYRLEWDER
jgi:Tol biopolymer transport system component/DNA-binding winged helix-turn-helix (wHTH) protein